MQPFAVVLAAGTSSRFGTTKQLEPWRGAALVRTVLSSAERACGERSLLVVGHDWQRVVQACRPIAGFIAINEAYRDGIGTSIRAAVRRIGHAADGILLLLADQPLVAPSHLEGLIERWRATPTAIIASRYADVVGPPVIFPRPDFAALAALEGDTGARSVVAAATARLITIECERAAVDIDRPEDLDALGRDMRDL